MANAIFLPPPLSSFHPPTAAVFMSKTKPLCSSQLVSDSADPYNQFPPSCSHFPPPYPAPPWLQHLGWEYSTPSFGSSPLPLHPHDFRSDSVLNFGFESKTDFRSKEFANSFTDSDENVKLGAVVISTTDLNFIKKELHQMIATTDEIQGRLKKLDSLLSHNQKMLSNAFPRAPTPSDLNLSSSDVSLMSFEIPTMNLDIPEKVYTSTEVTTVVKIAQTKVITGKTLAATKIDAPKKIKTCLPSWFTFVYFEFGNVDGADTMFGKFFNIMYELDINKVFDILLERKDRNISKNIIFIFDPGGETIDAENVQEISGCSADNVEIWSINGDSQLSDADVKKYILKWLKIEVYMEKGSNEICYKHLDEISALFGIHEKSMLPISIIFPYMPIPALLLHNRARLGEIFANKSSTYITTEELNANPLQQRIPLDGNMDLNSNCLSDSDTCSAVRFTSCKVEVVDVEESSMLIGNDFNAWINGFRGRYKCNLQHFGLISRKKGLVISVLNGMM